MAKRLIKLNNQGFTLTEVLVATVLFAFFITAFITSQNYNITTSRRSEEELILHHLAIQKIREVSLKPPELNVGATLAAETKSFDKEYSEYQYTVEIKKLTLPDFSKLMQNENETPTNDRNKDLNNLIFTKLKENVEKIVWQLKVTVTHKPSNNALELSRWITNHKQEVELNFAF